MNKSILDLEDFSQSALMACCPWSPLPHMVTHSSGRCIPRAKGCMCIDQSILSKFWFSENSVTKLIFVLLRFKVDYTFKFVILHQHLMKNQSIIS